ncbi:MAG: folate-binding protein [Rickettsiaceae bacterium H1]|nr:folate-binding protein [Rickettsiaceae bacterium H1]
MILLNNRAAFSLQGPDIYEFLQGVITNDVYKLSSHPIYTFLLNSQGKYLYDFFLIKNNNQILIDYEKEFTSDIVNLLKKYKVGLKVSLKSTEYKIYSSFTPINKTTVIQFTDRRSKNMGYRILSKEILSNSNDVDRYEITRIKNIIPDGKKDLINGKSFPFESNIKHAIDANKGCYVGQEVIARTISRGIIRKKLFMVECDINHKLPNHGTEIFDQTNNKLGEIRSSINNIGLALLKIEETKTAVKHKIDIVASEAKIKIHGI